MLHTHLGYSLLPSPLSGYASEYRDEEVLQRLNVLEWCKSSVRQ